MKYSKRKLKGNTYRQAHKKYIKAENKLLSKTKNYTGDKEDLKILKTSQLKMLVQLLRILIMIEQNLTMN